MSDMTKDRVFHWKIRDGYFKGPGTYDLQGHKILVDPDGCFEVKGPVTDVAFGIFASQVGSTNRD